MIEKRTLVTAAGQSIAMASEGAEVYATDVNATALEGLAHEGVHTFVSDVPDKSAIAAATATTGSI